MGCSEFEGKFRAFGVDCSLTGLVPSRRPNFKRRTTTKRTTQCLLILIRLQKERERKRLSTLTAGTPEANFKERNRNKVYLFQPCPGFISYLNSQAGEMRFFSNGEKVGSYEELKISLRHPPLPWGRKILNFTLKNLFKKITSIHLGWGWFFNFILCVFSQRKAS